MIPAAPGRYKDEISSGQAEIFNASNAPDLYETGGGHGQQGVDFQRYWAISRIIELVGNDAPDFLLLFETIQDVLELVFSPLRLPQ